MTGREMETADLDIRPLAPDLADLLIGLARSFHDEDGHPLTAAGEAALRRLCAGEPMARGWLVRRDAEAVGYVVLTFGFSVEHGGRDGFVDDLYLIPSARGSGLGARLIEWLAERARDSDVRVLHLEVERHNTRAQKLYSRHGFVDTGRRLMSRRIG